MTRLRFGTVSRRTATVRNTPCVRLPRYPNQRFGVPALLAPERNVSKERYCGAGQRYGRMKGSRSQVRVALSLGFGDGAGEPVGIGFHRGGIIAQGGQREKEKAPGA